MFLVPYCTKSSDLLLVTWVRDERRDKKVLRKRHWRELRYWIS